MSIVYVEKKSKEGQNYQICLSAEFTYFFCDVYTSCGC